MTYKIKAFEIFEKQVKGLDDKSARIIEDKIRLIKENPFRFKRLNSETYSRVFEVKLNIQSKATRLIYVVLQPNIILVCFLNRKDDFKDLEKYLRKLKNA